MLIEDYGLIGDMQTVALVGRDGGVDWLCAVRVIDLMPPRRGGAPRLIPIVEGLRGRVPKRMEFSPRPDHGLVRPWIDPAADGVIATSGPDAFRFPQAFSHLALIVAARAISEAEAGAERAGSAHGA